MINAARQFWDIETDSEPPRSLATYLRLLRDSAKWKNLRGGAISLAELAGFVGRLIFASMKSMIERVSGGGARSDKAIRKLRSLKARGVETAMFHGEDDTFLSEIEDNLRVGRHGLAGLSGMHTPLLPGRTSSVRRRQEPCRAGAGRGRPSFAIEPRQGSTVRPGARSKSRRA